MHESIALLVPIGAGAVQACWGSFPEGGLSQLQCARMKSIFGTLLIAALSIGFTVTNGSIPPLPSGNFAGYLSYEQTIDYINALHQAAPHLVGTPRVMGKSVEGRDVIAFCVGICNGKQSKTFMTGLTHSREVSSPDNAQKSLPHMLDKYNACSRSDCTSPYKQHMTL